MTAEGAPRPLEHRDVRYGETVVSCPVFDRASLPIEQVLIGPAVVEEDGATTFVPPDVSFRVDRHGLLLLEVGGSK